MALAVASLAYLAAHGARTPLLALRGLTRPRNVVLVLAPAVAVAVVAFALDGRVDAPTSQGALAVALVPAPLVAPSLLTRAGRRGDLAGALVLGTALLSVLVVGSRGALASGALFAGVEAFAIAAMFAGALPRLRDALLAPLSVVAWGATLAVFALALRDASLPDAATVIVAGALLAAGAAAAAALAVLQGRDVVAIVGGAGLRDGVLATALASVAFGPPSTGVPLVYAAFCLVLAALVSMHR